MKKDFYWEYEINRDFLCLAFFSTSWLTEMSHANYFPVFIE